jgi:heat shock protein HslJ
VVILRTHGDTKTTKDRPGDCETMRILLTCVLLLLLTLPLTACTGKIQTESGLHPTYTTDLTNTRWVPHQLPPKENEPRFEQEPYIQLQATDNKSGKMRGYGGCNQIQGSYSIDGEKLIFGPIMATRRYCEQMEFENNFTVALGKTDTFRISEDLLSLYRGKTLLAEFKAMYYQ